MEAAGTLEEADAGYFEELSVEDLICWADRATGGSWVVASSFQLNSLVVIHLAQTILGRRPKVLFLDTGFHFPETIYLRDQLAEEWGFELINVVGPGADGSQERSFGPDLPRRDPDLCCRINKVEPLWQTLEGFQGWMTGLRRSTPSRVSVPVVERHQLPGGRTIAKINPLARWSPEQVLAYAQAHNVPQHPLVEVGYRSIGCAPCTVPTSGWSDDDRVGRWPGRDKSECGIHMGPGAESRIDY